MFSRLIPISSFPSVSYHLNKNIGKDPNNDISIAKKQRHSNISDATPKQTKHGGTSFPNTWLLMTCFMKSNQLLNKDHTLPTCNMNSVGTDQLYCQESVCTWNKPKELHSVIGKNKTQQHPKPNNKPQTNETPEHANITILILHAYIHARS